MRFLLAAVLGINMLPAAAQTVHPGPAPDSDRDGLSDVLEDALLLQFAPRFMISDDDCSLRPAQFVPLHRRPQVQKENGAIYGQATPRAGHAGQVELHYYHLWRRDCGEMSHPLDAEHVSAIVIPAEGAAWKALYWYAAAHENTVCDASQITRASTLNAELHGPTVWVSRGKHASFLGEAICTHGCGGDECRAMVPLAGASVIDLGERSAAMNGATWAVSADWPLAEKMDRSDFADTRVARIDRLPATAIAWANPEKRPMQAAILGGNSALVGAATGFTATGIALDVASSNTGDALGTASQRTGNGLAKSARGVGRALRATARKLGIADQPAPPTSVSK